MWKHLNVYKRSYMLIVCTVYSTFTVCLYICSLFQAFAHAQQGPVLARDV